MADIEITRPHSFSKDEIRTRASEAAQDLEDEFGAETWWDGDDRVRFKVERFMTTVADGRLDMNDREVHLVITPSAMLPVSEEEIRRRAGTLLDERLAEQA